MGPYGAQTWGLCQPRSEQGKPVANHSVWRKRGKKIQNGDRPNAMQPPTSSVRSQGRLVWVGVAQCPIVCFLGIQFYNTFATKVGGIGCPHRDSVVLRTTHFQLSIGFMCRCGFLTLAKRDSCPRNTQVKGSRVKVEFAKQASQVT